MSVLQPELLGLVACLCLAGAVAGVTAGLFGIGGGFIIVPALLALFPFFGTSGDHLILLAIGTSLASIVVSSARSVQAHRKRGAVDFDVLGTWSLWLVLGVGAGLGIAAISDARQLFVLFACGVLVYAAYFLFPHWFRQRSKGWNMPRGAVRALLATTLGGFSALLGIGGGTVTVITMVQCNRPVHQAVGTAAGVGFIIAVPASLGFVALGLDQPGLPWGSLGYIHVPALLAISSLSVVTAPIGARWAHRLDELRLQRLFGMYLVFISLTMFHKSLSA